MIKLEKIVFNYKDKKRLFNNLDLIIKDGESIGVVGNNGTGKSTLIKLMLSILRPQQGDIYFGDKSVYKFRRKLMSKIGVVWGQRSSLWWDLSIRRSIEILCKIYDVNPEKMVENLEYYGEKVTLKYYWNNLLRKVSYGQRVQADIIAVLIREPKYIFLDEAFIGLDYHTKETIIELLCDYKQTHPDCILVITSHNFLDITKLCDRLLILREDGSAIEYLTKNVLSVKYTELLIEFDREVELLESENIEINKMNSHKVKILIQGRINNFLQKINWDTVLSIDLKDKTVDMVIKKIDKGDLQ
ncbi:ATP-binding cassette domain-containing protein [Bulleidia sp. zg-1006]|uniref:ATP-binding cassette domain-containing protein n=1 Tax=Bulleidia sp. zg-1006 TaxID=2806552 RepID=UPI00193A818B|nr:ATP-binding cassette domain-containing protein [Bulleidia sp. zg-1006]QRG87215.1 ATP-binding cassette domain-containing protein [Bulleidia sp. zg-1006]